MEVASERSFPDQSERFLRHSPVCRRVRPAFFPGMWESRWGQNENGPTAREARRPVLLASTVTLLVGALFIGGAMWYVSRLGNASPKPSPMVLAHRVRDAHLGCDVARRDASDAFSFGHAQAEVDCGAASTFIAIARFDSARKARSSLREYVCAASSSQSSFVLGGRWAAYAASPATLHAIATTLHGTVEPACA
jgi:hypothetical protein